jgi:hypothetical protein
MIGYLKSNNSLLVYRMPQNSFDILLNVVVDSSEVKLRGDLDYASAVYCRHSPGQCSS